MAGKLTESVDVWGIPSTSNSEQTLEEASKSGVSFRLDDNDGDRFTIIAASKEGKDVGHILCTIESIDSDCYVFSPYENEAFHDEICDYEEVISIQHLEVDKQYQGQGVATELMKRATKEIKKRWSGVPVYINASPTGGPEGISLDALVSFYQSFGFKVLKKYPAYRNSLLWKESVSEGARGDWEKEGYKIIIGDPFIHKDGEEYVVDVISPDGDEAGYFKFNHWYDHPSHGEILHVMEAEVYTAHRRKGIASAVYQKMEELTGVKINNELDQQSSDAKALWSQPKRPFGESVDSWGLPIVSKGLTPAQRAAGSTCNYSTISMSPSGIKGAINEGVCGARKTSGSLVKKHSKGFSLTSQSIFKSLGESGMSGQLPNFVVVYLPEVKEIKGKIHESLWQVAPDTEKLFQSWITNPDSNKIKQCGSWGKYSGLIRVRVDDSPFRLVFAAEMLENCLHVHSLVLVMDKAKHSYSQICESVERLKSIKELKNLAPELAKAAQAVYDDWGMDEFGNVWCRYQEGPGGICHLIADEMISVISGHGFDCTELSHDSMVHVSVLVKTAEGVAEVDIDPYRYETGGGYSWEKIPDVQFDPEDVTVHIINRDPEVFDQHLEEY